MKAIADAMGTGTKSLVCLIGGAFVGEEWILHVFHWFFDCFGVWKPKGMESQEATGVNSDTWLQAR